ncbi:MAG: SpvB/TcaC N-terminal domain-containing protein, partial [Candidatus Paceibacterota bacterium]
MIRMKKFFVSLITIVNLSVGFPFSQVFAQEAIAEPIQEAADIQVPVEISPADSPAPPLDTSTLEAAITASSDSSTAIVPSESAEMIPTDDFLKTNEEPVEQPVGTESMMDEEGEFAPRPTDMAISEKQLAKSDESTGAFVYEYRISVPHGRNGMEPELTLQYNSQNKENSIFGSGWSDTIPFIKRINKRGTETILSDNYFTSSLDGELVQTSTTTYRAKVENDSFNSYSFENNAWLITTKSGNTYQFGYSADARQDNPSDSEEVYKWMVEEVRDTNGNSVDYSYYKDAGQIYPETVSYTNNASSTGIFEIEFLREDRNDIATSSASGFPVVTKRREKEILVRTSGEITHRYVLSYTAGDNGLRSLFFAIQESGWDSGQGTTTLPAVQFGYSASTNHWTENTDSSKWQLTGGQYFVDVGEDGGGRVIDFNGDSLPDLIWSGRENWEHSYLNTGSTWATTTGYASPEPFAVPFDMGLRFGDINGDGYVDQVVSRTIPGNPRPSYKAVYLGGAGGWTSTSDWTPPISFADTFSMYSYDLGVRLTDVNGDGLADITGDSGTYINNGKEFVYDSLWDFPTPLVQTYGGDIGVRIVDVNNDGLADVLVSRDSVGGDTGLAKHAVYLNVGHSWEETAGFVPPVNFVGAYGDAGYRLTDINGDNLIDIVGNEGLMYKNTGSGWGQTSSAFPTSITQSNEDLGVSIDDVNGDGLPDVIKNRRWIYVDYHQTQTVWVKDGVKADLLTSIANEKGAITTAEYAHTAELADDQTQPNPNLQFNFDVVENIVTDPGLGGEISTTTYAYSDGLYYTDEMFDRKFVGFAKITKTDDDGNVTKTYYHQGTTTNDYGGKYEDHISKMNKPYRIEKYDNDENLYSLTVNKWDKYDITASSTFVKLARTTEENFDGNSSHKDKAETYSYDDDTGNLSEKITWGEVSGSNDGSFTDAGTDKATYAYSYAASSTNSVISLPSRELVTDYSSNTAKDTKWYYDGLSFGYFDKGNSTKEEKLISGSSYASTTKTYDGTYGLITAETDARGNATSYSYDTPNLFVATSTNPLGHTRNFQYDYSSGNIATTTDENGRIFATVYDALDRAIEEKQPDQTTPSALVTKSAYAYTDTSLAVAVQKTNYLDASLANTTYAYKDGLGRTIQTRMQTELSDIYTVSDAIFDARGMVKKESLPYFSSGAARTGTTTVNALYASYVYDSLGRVTEISNAVGTTTNAYDDWKVTTTDARGKQKIFTKDAYGNLVKVEEKNNGDTYTTNYEYNPLGNLTKITDAEANVRNFTYDKLGRRLTAQDLHASGDETYGSWSYSYDDAGNTTQTVDPKEQTINYEFDALNRNTSENYTSESGTEVSYAYDTCTNGKMRLCAASSTDVISSFSYSPLGQVSTEAKMISDISATTTYEYDRQGNQTLITTPDGAEIRYTYNAAGLLDKVEEKENGGSFADIVSNFDYAPTGQPTIISYANGVTTNKTYDASELYRLRSIRTSAPESMNLSASKTESPNANISSLLIGKTSSERANIKGAELAKLQSLPRTEREKYGIQVVSMEPIEGGLQVFARAWDKEGKPIGFGKDGTVETERFRFFNPPILVPDGTYREEERKMFDGETKKVQVENLVENPKEAVLTMLEQVIAIVGKDWKNIIAGKIGNTTSTFYPAAGSGGDSVDGHGANDPPTENFSNLRSLSTLDGVGYTSTTGEVVFVASELRSTSPNKYTIVRPYFTFYTQSALSEQSVSSATLSIKTSIQGLNVEATGLTQSTQAANNNLQNSDWSALTLNSPAEGSSRVTPYSNSTFYSWTLNGTGLSWIKTSGSVNTKFVLRTARDIANTTPTGDRAYRDFYAADITGTTNDPKLVVEHVALYNGPLAPTGLLVNGSDNPDNITGQSVYFSSIHQNASSTAFASSYQIQVTASSTSWISPYWDSGKNTLSSSTPAGVRVPNIYSAATFPLDGSTYYWRMKFWDQFNLAGEWSTTTAIFTMATTSTGNLLQEMTYTYDAAGNITRIENISSTAAQATYDYVYDDLNRLLTARLDESESQSMSGKVSSEFLSAFSDDSLSSSKTESPNASISSLLIGKTSSERANIKGAELAKLQSLPRTEREKYDIQIVSMEPIEGGLQVFARAWDKEGKQIGFGKDGTVETERFRFFNPPILVPDGTYREEERVMFDGETKKVQVENLVENPKEAVLTMLEQVIAIVGKDGKNIIAGKIGNTTSTFYPAAGSGGDSVDGYLANDPPIENFPNLRSLSTLDGVGYVSTAGEVMYVASELRSTSPNKYTIIRPYLTFYTQSALSEQSVSSATLSIKTSTQGLNVEATGLTQSTQTSNSNLQNSDWSALTLNSPAEGSSRVTPSSNSTFYNWTLNGTGLSWIKTSGSVNTKFVLRTARDIENTTPTGERAYRDFYTADTTGTTNDPKLVVEHAYSGPLAPTDLLTNGLTNPTDVSVSPVSFSSIHQNGSPIAIAASYQIQVSTSTSWTSPYWDSGKNALSSSTPAGMRTPEIYATTTFSLDGTAYCWRMKLWDQEDFAGEWSTTTATFAMMYDPVEQPTYAYDAIGNII